MGRLILGIAVFVIIGIPMVAYVWQTISQLLMGQIAAARTLAAVMVAVLLGAWLRLLARTLVRWEGELK